ncbi:hypothetical protein L6452_11885 [Arctium lappa]|uniref:Uncharacterized protein n=1 Tax=Arctium lappa TaxID=4217 RepID=A0ACB9DR17_ARCLA|nr:hypothetical protein L6452_11885 [Arctium lappa]
MDMHEAIDESDDTLSLSDLQIYSDPSSSSNQEQEDHENSFPSFRFKIITNSRSSPPPQNILVFGNSISVPDENDPIPYRNPHKPSTMKTLPVANLAPIVLIPRRRRWLLMFGLGGSRARIMELSDLRSRQARGTPRRITPVNGGGEESTTAHRRSGNWLGKLFGPCIPIV